jgi:hypothetical protein
MAIEFTKPLPATIDVSGLSPDAVEAVASFVAHLRTAEDTVPLLRFASGPHLSDADFERLLNEFASGPSVPTLPADWSRADLYEDHD